MFMSVRSTQQPGNSPVGLRCVHETRERIAFMTRLDLLERAEEKRKELGLRSHRKLSIDAFGVIASGVGRNFEYPRDGLRAVSSQQKMSHLLFALAQYRAAEALK